jgi:choline-sulfatase
MQPTNLLFLCSDEHQRAITGCYGNRIVRTPNLDRLARFGTVFGTAYCNSPLCVPSRASLATGRYAHAVRAWCNATAYAGDYAQSWGHRLVSQGHGVTTIGKLHYQSEAAPTGFPDQRIPMHLRDGVGDARGLLRGEMPVSPGFREHVSDAGPGESPYIQYDEAITAQAKKWLAAESRGHAKPWALFVSFLSPHYPLTVPQRFLDLYPEEVVPLPVLHRKDDWPTHPALALFRRLRGHDEPYDIRTLRRAIATYYGMVSFLDEQIGRVLRALEDAGHLDDTRIIYTTDHGEHLGNHGLWWKRGFYDSAAAVPLLVAGPGVRERNCATVTSLVDLFPTIIDTVGARPTPAEADLPGRSLYSILSEGQGLERTAFAEYHGGGSAAASYMIRSDRYKYVHYCDGPPQLFDMQADPHETADLAASPAHAGVLAAHLRLLYDVCDPDRVDRAAKADQAALAARLGGAQAILDAPTMTFFPPPETAIQP